MLNRLVNKIGRVKNQACYNYFPLQTRLVRQRENVIFMYHGVDSNGANAFNQRHTGIANFEKQVAYLTSYCNVLSLEDYFEKKFDKGRINVVLTFDDGYLNNFLYARPILERYKANATIFVTGVNRTKENMLWADFIDVASKLKLGDVKIEKETFFQKNDTYYNENGESLYSFVKSRKSSYDFKLDIYRAFDDLKEFKKEKQFHEYWKLMSDEQITEISKSKYIKIGSHGFYHNNLNNIPIDDAVSELKMSKSYLEELTQYDINSIGYPDGGYTPDLLEEAFKLGFVYQLATECYVSESDKTDSRIMNRIGIYNCDTWGNQLR